VTFGGSVLIRGVAFGGSVLWWKCPYKRGGFGGSVLIRGVAFGGSVLIRGGLLIINSQVF
jgi:hypothetical protein